MRRIKNKRAWVAVIEAVLGILILFTFVMVILSRNNANNEQGSAMDFQALFLNEIENNQELRNNILSNDEVDINNSLRIFLQKFNMNYNLDVCIKNMQDNSRCPLYINSKEIIAYDYFVAANKDSSSFEPKKLKIFLWRKE